MKINENAVQAHLEQCSTTQLLLESMKCTGKRMGKRERERETEGRRVWL